MSEQSLRLSTRCAHWGWDDHRYFGHSVFGDLAGRESMVGLSALSVLGRRLSKESCDVLDDIACTSTLADPRIWPLKISRLIACYGSTMPAVAAGLLIQEGARIGPWKATDAAIALSEMHAAIDGRFRSQKVVNDVVKSYFSNHKIIAGFGTPYRNRDERLEALKFCMKQRNRDQLPYWCSMLAIGEVVREQRQIAPNIVFGIAAALLDLGMANTEVGPVATVLFQHMFVANAMEGAKQAPSDVRELPERHISYVGVSDRVSARANSRTSMLQLRQPQIGDRTSQSR